MKAFLRKLSGNHEISLAIILVVLFIVVDILSGFTFHGIGNIGEIFKNNSLTLIMSLGMLCVLLTGGIDISITGVLAFAGMTVGMLQKYSRSKTGLVPFAFPLNSGFRANSALPSS